MITTAQIIVMAIGGSLVQTPSTNLSLPASFDAPDCLTRLGLEPEGSPPWLKVHRPFLKWAIV